MLNGKTVTIASGDTTSGEARLSGLQLRGLEVPTIDTGDITFTASADGETYRTLKDPGGTTYTLTAGTGNAVFMLDPNAFRGVNWLKIVAASQSADRTIKLLTSADA
jgi:hypothetical protein